jgi:hypothetical protein
VVDRILFQPRELEDIDLRVTHPKVYKPIFGGIMKKLIQSPNPSNRQLHTSTTISTYPTPPLGKIVDSRGILSANPPIFTLPRGIGVMPGSGLPVDDPFGRMEICL